MENFTTKLTQREFDSYSVHYPTNLVIVKMPPEHDIKVAGITVNFNPDTLYAEGEGSHVADVAPVYGTVVKQVERLYFNPKDVVRTMSWETTLETEIGDTVWFHHLISKNCCEFDVDGTIYKVIPYEDLFVAKRGKDQVICLNGNVLLEEVPLPRLSELDVLDKDTDKTRGIVRYNGSDNKRYQVPSVADMPNLKEGDVVVIDKKAYVFYLERSKYNSNFQNGEMFICIQKKFIQGVIN